MSEEYYKIKRWEGKSWGFKLRYAFANYPECVLSMVAVGIIAPLIAIYRIQTFEGSRNDVKTKYKGRYMVVRDDDPRVPKIIEEKEKGRHHFPE